MSSQMKFSRDYGNNLAGRTSRQDALNQLKGNLERSLEVFDPWEIIVVILKLERSKIRNTTKPSLEKRMDFLENLRWFHIKSLQITHKEIRRTQSFLSDELKGEQE